MQSAAVKACCADLYQSELARLFLGETLHPGGLALTNRLGRLMGIQPGDWVVDLASGKGVSAAALSRVFHCRVVGVEFGARAIAEAQQLSSGSPAPAQTFFLQGDTESLPLRPSSIDRAMCECSISTFPNKYRAIREALQVLRPGGTLGISDVTLEPHSLPEELNGMIGRVLCLADALDADGYARLLKECGLAVQHREDASTEVLKLLDDLEARLGTLLAWLNTRKLITKLRELVREGKLGYWLFVAQKPQ